MSVRRCLYVLICVALASALGCKLVERHAVGKSPLQAAKPSSDSVGLEIFFARLPTAQAEQPDVWQAVDEQQLATDVRARLAQNGFRAGIVSSPLPKQLCDLLKIAERPASKEIPSKANLTDDPEVTLRLLQTRSGHRGEIIASKMYAELPVLSREHGQVRGRTYRQADCRFSLVATRAPNNYVELELSPEVQHGDPQLRKVVGDGTLRLEPGRPRQCFDDLKARMSLCPGQMLVFASRPDMPGSLGHYFFTDAGGEKPTRKILLIRLAQAGDDELFTGAGVGDSQPITLDEQATLASP